MMRQINVCFKEFPYSQRSLQNNIWKGFLHILKYDNCLTDKYVGLEEHNTYLNELVEYYLKQPHFVQKW